MASEYSESLKIYYSCKFYDWMFLCLFVSDIEYFMLDIHGRSLNNVKPKCRSWKNKTETADAYTLYINSD